MIAPTIRENSNNNKQQPTSQESSSSNARPSSNGCTAEKDPSESGSSSPPDDEDDSTDLRSKIHVRILPPASIASLLNVPVRPAYDGEPTELEKAEGEKRLKLVIEILAEADLKRLQAEVK